jgi:hypothetical protein
MSALQQNSVNKGTRKTTKVLVTSVSIAALAVGLSFPIGSAVLTNAEQMGGAPGAAANVSSEDQKKNDAIAIVKRTYDFRPSATTAEAMMMETDANVKANTSEAFYARCSEDKKVLNYDPLTHSQQVAQSSTYGPAYINGDTIYVAVDQYADPQSTQKLRDLVVAVDAASGKITGVGGEYK